MVPRSTAWLPQPCSALRLKLVLLHLSSGRRTLDPNKRELCVMECCVRRKAPMCAHCGAEVDVHRARAVLLFGLLVRFCNRDCQRAFLDAWRLEAEAR